MNKRFLLALAAIALPSLASAVSLEVRAAAFFPVNDRMQKVYEHALPVYQVEATLPVCGCFEIFANGEYFTKKGTLREACGGSSRLTAFNGSLGVKIEHCFCSQWQFYGGLGVVLGQVNLKNHTRCHGTSHQHPFAVGGVLKTGIHYFISQCAYLDLFADYVYQPVRFKHRTVDVGGPRVGLGIGFKL